MATLSARSTVLVSALTLLSAGGLLAQSPTREFIYVNGRLVAVEAAATGAATYSNLKAAPTRKATTGSDAKAAETASPAKTADADQSSVPQKTTPEPPPAAEREEPRPTTDQ